MKIASKWCLGILATVLLTGGTVFGQSSFDDPNSGNVRISSSAPKQGIRPVQFESDRSGSAVAGGGYDPINDLAQGQPIYDPAFRAANGLGEPTYGDYDHAWYRVGHQAGQLYGYDDGYTTLSALLPVRFIDPDTMFALNPYVVLNDSAGASLSAGALWRRRDVEHDRVFGAGLWWDYDRANIFDYHRIGLSFEAITRYVSYRLNYNAVVGEHQRVYGASIGNNLFQGNSIAYQVNQLIEAPYDEVALNVAWPLPVAGKYGAEGGVGIYGLFGNGQTGTAGFLGRLNWQLTEDLSVTGLVSHDRVFDTRVSLGFELTIPDAKPSRILRPNPVAMAMVQSTQRNFRTPVVRSTRTLLREEFNQKTNAAFRIAHIDPNAAAGGNGTIETPFQSLFEYEQVAAADRAAFDIIRVVPRADGTSTNLDTGIDIFSTQRLLSSSLAHNYTSARGTFALPGQTVGAGNPFISDADVGGLLMAPRTSVIQLGDPLNGLAGHATEINGFTIGSPTSGIGIASAVGTTVDGYNIHGNTFVDAINTTVIRSDTSVLLNCPGEDLLIFDDNVLTGTAGTSLDGTILTHVAGDAQFSIARNTVTDFDGGTGLRLIADGPGANLVGVSADGSRGVLDNTVTGSGGGIELAALNGGSINTDFERNTVTGSTDPTLAGFTVTAGAGSSVTLDTFSNNSATGGAGDGASMVASAGGQIIGVDPFISNTFDNNGNHGFFSQSTGGGSLTDFDLGDPDPLNPVGNTANGNVADGFHIEADTTGLADVGLYNNTANTNGGNGIQYLLNGTTEDLIAMIGNTATGNTLDGVLISATNTPITDITLDTNILDGNTVNGLRYFGDNGDVTGLFSVTNSSMDGNTTGDGFNITQTNGSDITGLFIDTNSIDNNTAGHGINFNTVSGALPTIGNAGTISNNTINGNGLNGVNLDLPNTGGVPIALNFDTNDISGNTGLGINAIIDDTSGSLTSALTANTITGNGGIGALFDASQNTVLDLTIGGADPLLGNVFDGNADANLAIQLTDNATIPTTMLIQNNDFTNAVNGADVTLDGEGINIVARNNTAIRDAQLLDNTITGNASDGIRAIFNDNAQINVAGDPTMVGLTMARNIVGAAGAGNGGHGLNVQFNDFTTGAIDMTDDIFTENGLHGINIHKRNFATLGLLNFNNVESSTNGQDGVHLLLQNDPGATVAQRTVTFNVVQGLFDGNGTLNIPNEDHGIHVVAQHNAIFNNTIDQVTSSNNNGDGVLFEFDNAATTGTPITWTNNMFTDNATGNGGHISTAGDSITTANILMNLFSGNVNGFTQTANNASSNTVTFTGNMLVDNTGNGVDLNALATLTQVPPGQLTFNGDMNIYTGNTLAGLSLAGNGGTSTVGITNSFFQNNGDGINTNVTGGTHTVTIDDNMILNSTDDGIETIVTGGTHVINVGTVSGNTPTNSIVEAGDDGIVITQSGGTLTGDYNNILVRDSGDNGVQIASSGGTFDVMIRNSNILSNTGRGIEAIFTGTNIGANSGAEAQVFPSGILVAGDFDRNLQILNNAIQGNGEEGLFLHSETDSLNTTNIVEELGQGNRNIPFEIDFTDRLRVNVVAVGNAITGNGTIVDSHGTNVEVGMNTLMQLDYRQNVHSGNQLTDFFTRSFNNLGNPTNSTFDDDTDGGGPDPNLPERYRRDDVAELRLRFRDNTGDSIGQLTALGATFNNNDVLKGNGTRFLDFFRVEPDVAGGLNATNIFTQDLTIPLTPFDIFNGAGYIIVPAGTMF
ncbi:MAG: hypothetical protein R3C01_10385 [Planctomycetaceae bacterium]